jgi:hypothetical protein
LFFSAAAVLGCSVPLLAVAPRPSAAAHSARLDSQFGQTPLAFEENRGQTDSSVRFLARESGLQLFLTDREAVVKLSPARGSTSGPAVLRMAFESTSGGKPVGVDPLPQTSNYFVGNDPSRWRTGVPSFQTVRYPGVYPGVDLVYHGERRQLEFDLVVAPGADPRRIVLDIDGAAAATRDSEGSLVLATAGGDFRLVRPTIYQELPNGRQEITGEYALLPGSGSHRRVAVSIGSYDRSRPLVIDPELRYSTYLGGADDDVPSGIAVDGAGNAYVTGSTASAEFPGVGSGSLQPANAGQFDVFVTKIDPAGTSVVYSTFLGGSGGESAGTMAVDSAGNAYIVGLTFSSDFPVLHPIQAHNAGLADAFVAKIAPSGDALVYSTYLGGSSFDYGYAIAIDSSGNAYLTGDSASLDFPGTVDSPIQSSVVPGKFHAWVTKIDAAGTAIVFSTYLGGKSFDDGYGIAVDGQRNVYVTGQTTSSDFIGAAGGPIQAALGGSSDAFVTKIDASGTALVYSTFLGGSGSDIGLSIAVDSNRDAYVTGGTASPDFPKADESPIQDHNGGGGNDAFVAKIDAAGGAIVYSTYLGGSGHDVGAGIAVDSSGTAYVAGGVESTGFPGTSGSPIQSALSGKADAFVTAIDPAGSAILFSTYFGGNATDGAYAIALDSGRNVYITGGTVSGDLPGASASPIQPHFAGGSLGDAFVAKIATVSCPTEPRPCVLAVEPRVPEKIAPRP